MWLLSGMFLMVPNFHRLDLHDETWSVLASLQ